MTNLIRSMSRSAALLFAVMALVGCSQKKTPQVPEPDTTLPIKDKAIAPPVENPTDKGGKPKDAPITKTETETPVLDAIKLTRELSKNPAAAERYENKVIRIEGVVREVKLKLSGNDPTEADISLRGATDSPNRESNINISCDVGNKADAAKVGPGQTVTLQGTFKKSGNLLMILNAIVVKAGPVAYTQVELDRIQKEEPKALAELTKLGVQYEQRVSDYHVTLRNEDLTPEGIIKPEVLTPFQAGKT